MNQNNIYDVNSNYFMGIDKHLISQDLLEVNQVRIYFLIPQLNTKFFYKLSIVDSFAVYLLENNKFEINYKPNDNDSITLFLIKKQKDSFDDTSKDSLLSSSINSCFFSDFALKKAMDAFTDEIFNQLKIDYQNKPFVNKEILIEFINTFKNKLSSFLTKVNCNDTLGLISEYDYIETKSLRGITEAIHENNKIHETKLNYEGLQTELQSNTKLIYKKAKL